MPFTVNEFQDLLAILRAQPAWKEALRRELLGEELLMLPALVRDLVRAVEAMNQRLGLVEERLDKVEQRLDKVEQRLDKVEQRLDKVEQRLDKVEQRLDKVEQRLDRVEQDLSDLKVRVVRLEHDVADLKGESLERRYRERAFAYFHRLVRKPRALTDAELGELLTKAQDEGVLTADEVGDLARLDALIQGRSFADGEPVYLAVEVSAKIDAQDLARATRRAALLAKIPGVRAVPAVAGNKLTAGAKAALQTFTGWVLLNGAATEHRASAAPHQE